MVTSSHTGASLAQKIKKLELDNLALREEIAAKNTYDVSVWSLFVEISRRLQASSASIKAAVTSLLDDNILWDGCTQHEFLETIDLSANQIGDLILFSSLMFRSEAGGLEIKREPQVLMEILAVATDYLSGCLPGKQVNLQMPNEGKLVLVDYEYSVMALKLLFGALAETHAQNEEFRINALEIQDRWLVQVYGFDPSAMILIHQLLQSVNGSLTNEIRLSAENRLRVFLAGRIFHLQQIETVIHTQPGEDVSIGLILPAVD